jgi:hypothetical protein
VDQTKPLVDFSVPDVNSIPVANPQYSSKLMTPSVPSRNDQPAKVGPAVTPAVNNE